MASRHIPRVSAAHPAHWQDRRDFPGDPLDTRTDRDAELFDRGGGGGFGSELDTRRIDPRAIWAAVLRNKWAVIAIVVLALAIGIISVMLATPIYRATASVQIEQQVARVLGTEGEEEAEVTGSEERFLQTQVDILQSRGLAEQVVDELKLVNNEAFLEAAGFDTDALPANRAELRSRAASALQDMTSVSLPGTSRVARINVTSSDRDVAAQVANAYVDAFITGNLQRKFDQSAYSRRFLQDQLEQTRIRLEESERAMVQFARNAGLIELAPVAQEGATGGSQSLVTSDLVQLNTALASATAARIAAEQQWAQTQAAPDMTVSEVLADPGVQGVNQQLAQARVDLTELQQRYKADHPLVQQKADVIGALERELSQRAANIKASIRDRYVVARRQEASLRANVSGLRGETLNERGRTIEYNILRRDVDTNRELYDALLQRYKELSAAAGVTTNNISVIDRAERPGAPISPVPTRTIPLALLLGFAAAGAFVYAREKLADAIRTPEDVENRAGLPLLGVTPLLKDGVSPLEALQDPKSSFSEAIHALRTSLELATREGLPKSLSLTSVRPGEGKSTLAYALGREFALTGKRVLLIDADMRAPSLHRFLSARHKTGLSQVLAKQAAPHEAVVHTDIAGLDFISSGPLPPDPTLLLDGTRLQSVLDSLKGYDLVVIDSPPILGLADTLQIGAVVEGTLMVIEADGTRFAELRAALGRLYDSRMHLFGAALSKFDAGRFGYGKYYGYYYSHYGQDADKAVIGKATID